MNGGWPGALTSSKRMLNGMSSPKQCFSTSEIKWWKNKSWKTTCVTQDLGLFFHIIRSEPFSMFSVGEGKGGIIWENGIETCIISYKK